VTAYVAVGGGGGIMAADVDDDPGA
jgi:hypothetical protein